jgi:DNA-directed RNA polymerase subunit RPC12/RpoP
MPTKKLTIQQLECGRCFHTWWPRINKQDKTLSPTVCPKCKSRYWDQERKIVYKNKTQKGDRYI